MAVLSKRAEIKPDLLAAYPEPADEAGWARAVRERAEMTFLDAGAPTRRDEYWKFTDPSGLTAVPAPSAAVLEVDEAPMFDVVDRVTLVFVDGEFAPDLSDDPAAAGIECQPLADVLQTDIHWARDLYGVLEARGQDPVRRPLAALNTARATQGMAIRVSGAALKPVNFMYLHRSETSDALIHHVIKLEPGADLVLLENGPAAARFNKVLELEIGDGAALHHVRTQGRDHQRQAATATFARLGREASLKSFTLTVNGVLTRNEAIVEFTGENAIAHVAGACAGDGDFHHDDTVFVTHDAPGCESRQVFKKVLRGGAVGVFQGKILVKHGAQKTDGYQISQGLLLDDNSQFLAKPELEIYADDVVCSHGSTSGAIDADSLFYLTSRGIPRREAEEILVLAFLDEAIAEIEDDAIKAAIRDRLAAWLARRRT